MKVVPIFPATVNVWGYPMKRIAEIERNISYAVAEHYLQTGQPSSVSDIAHRIGCSLASAYRALHRVDGMITGIMSYDEIGAPETLPAVPNAQRLGPYYPAPYFLRELILENRISTKTDTGEKADLAIVRSDVGEHSQNTKRGD